VAAFTTNEEAAMAHLRKTVSIAASPDAVWRVLGDLAATPEWNPGTVAARMEDSVRVCRTTDGGEIREEIRDYSAERRGYRFRHLRVPLPVASSGGAFSVEPGDGGGSVVVLDAEFEPLDPAAAPELERMLGRALEQALASLRRRVEEGRSWQEG
jgi:uncharacterized protein YndB with AHSA1/START domain